MYRLCLIPTVQNITCQSVGHIFRPDGRYWDEDWIIFACYDCAFKYNLPSLFYVKGSLTTSNGPRYAGSPWAPCYIKSCLNYGNYQVSRHGQSD